MGRWCEAQVLGWAFQTRGQLPLLEPYLSWAPNVSQYQGPRAAPGLLRAGPRLPG